MRLFHCTTVELTSANTPNVGISDVQFLVVGTAFALSRIILLEKIFFFTVVKLFLYFPLHCRAKSSNFLSFFFIRVPLLKIYSALRYKIRM